MILAFVTIKYLIISVDRLAGTSGEEGQTFCWDLILVYVVLKYFQGGGTGSQGLLNILRSFLWIRIQQYTTREIQVHTSKVELMSFFKI